MAEDLVTIKMTRTAAKGYARALNEALASGTLPRPVYNELRDLWEGFEESL